MMNKIVSGLGIGLILQWIALFASYQKLPNAYEDISKPIATGGFPVQAFEYPVPPLGGDWPPAHMWPSFFLNLAIWLAVGLIFAFMLGGKLKDQRTVKIIMIIAFVTTFLGIKYINLLFD